MKKNHWYVVKGQSLAFCARRSGFDLAIYDEYDGKVQVELRKRAVEEALRAIEAACDDVHDLSIYDIKSGVYVISLSNPLSIQ